jgi:hypothetical protein
MKLKNIVPFVFLLLAGGSAHAADDAAPVSEGFKTEFLSFRAFQVSSFQSSGGRSYSGGAGWSPAYHLWGNLGLRLNVNGMLQKKASGVFMATNGNLGPEYMLFGQSISVAVSGGASYWFSNGGLAPLINGGLGYHLPTPLFHYIDRITADYSYIAAKDKTHEVRVGVGITF